jgi:DNA-binding CsgD family transcriptional regulator
MAMFHDRGRTIVRRLTDAGRAPRVAAVLFAIVAALIGLDLAGDARTGATPAHLLVEAAAMILAGAGAVGLWGGLRSAHTRNVRLESALDAARGDAERFRAEAQEALEGLGAAIDRQFERWGLTPAEREVGLLLLKGLSHREAAIVRSTTEQTVRQQALMIYRKSGLHSRAELSAFFLEDLLLPRTEAAVRAS